jgi:hypothetical protein
VGDIATTKQFTSGQLGVDGPDLNEIVGNASINPQFYSAKTTGNSPGDSDTLLLLGAGGSYYQIPINKFFTNQKWVQQSLLPFVNTLINGDTSVWQWGTTFTNPATGSYLSDRFRADYVLASGGKINAAQTALAGSLTLPGGYQPINCLRISVNTVQASLAAGDFLTISQRVELQEAIKLFGGVSSLQIWVRAANAGTYTLFLQNANQTQSYKQDFTVGTPNVWQQLTLPAIPSFPTGLGTWGTNPPDWSYTVGICLGAGTTFQDSTQSQWETANKTASSSTTNFLATSGNTIDLCLAQHEMGPLPTIFRPDDSISVTQYKCYRYAVGFISTIVGLAAGAGVIAGACQLNPPMRAVPTIASTPAPSYHAGVGSNGTPSITTGATPVVNGLIFANSATNWTANAPIQFTGVITAEL